MPHRPTDEGLLRVIGPAALAASIINVVVGGGIFVLPAVVARELGGAAILAYLTGAVVIGLVTLCFAEAGKRVSRSGGAYAYTEAAFGPAAGFLTGVLVWLAGVFASAAVAAALIDSLSTVIPALAQPVVRTSALLVLLASLTAINLRGVQGATRFTAVTAAAKFLGLVLFLALGVGLVQKENLAWTTPPTLESVGRGTILIIFALAGMEVALGASGEIRDPRRTVPRALISAIAIVTLLYVALQLVAQGSLGAAIAESKAPLADALARAGLAGRNLILALGAISMVGFLCGEVLGTSRVLYAFGRDGILPRRLGAVHPKTHIPHVAVVTHATIIAALAVSGTFTILAPIASVAIVLLYVSVCAAAWVLQRQTAAEASATMSARATGLPVLSIIALIWVLAQSTRLELLAVGGLLAGAGVIYWLGATARRRQASPAPIE